jgi:hypothetical protein
MPVFFYGQQESSMRPSADLYPTKKSSASARQAECLEQRALRPGQAGIAWERLKRVVRDNCRNASRPWSVVSIYAGTIEFRSTQDDTVITLIREDNRIRMRMHGSGAIIHIVRLKTSGAGFELRRRRYTATRLFIEIILQARVAAGGKTS